MPMKDKMKPLPPGVYTVKVDRVRKVRNKDQKRIYVTVLETEHQIAETLNPEPYNVDDQ